jgi:nucleoside-diphosphate kinase
MEKQEKTFKPERTLIAIKPEAIQRRLIGEIIAKFEKRGLKLIASKLIAPTEEQVGTHYADDEAWYLSSGTKTYNNYKDKGIDPGMTPIELGKRTRQMLLDHLTNRPVLFMIWEGPHAVALGRKTAGATNPLVADIGSIRGDYSTESYEMSDELGRAIHSIVHASGSVEEAETEIGIWFKPGEIFDYEMIDEHVFYTKDWGRIKK